VSREFQGANREVNWAEQGIFELRPAGENEGTVEIICKIWVRSAKLLLRVALSISAILRCRRSYGFGFRSGRFRRRAPGPPPFSSMNSTPTLSSATSWGDFHKPAVVFRRLFSGRSLRLSKADAFTRPVFVNELDPGSFKRLPNGRFVCGRNGDLSVNHFHTADRCDSDF
jgi:hypothetical protein